MASFTFDTTLLMTTAMSIFAMYSPIVVLVGGIAIGFGLGRTILKEVSGIL
jgi:hypothetical protein